WLWQQHAAQQAQQGAFAAPACALQKNAFSALDQELRDGQAKAMLAGPLKNEILYVYHKRAHEEPLETRSTTSVEWIRARVLRWTVLSGRLPPHQGAADRGMPETA